MNKQREKIEEHIQVEAHAALPNSGTTLKDASPVQAEPVFEASTEHQKSFFSEDEEAPDTLTRARHIQPLPRTTLSPSPVAQPKQSSALAPMRPTLAQSPVEKTENTQMLPTELQEKTYTQVVSSTLISLKNSLIDGLHLLSPFHYEAENKITTTSKPTLAHYTPPPEPVIHEPINQVHQTTTTLMPKMPAPLASFQANPSSAINPQEVLASSNDTHAASYDVPNLEEQLHTLAKNKALAEHANTQDAFAQIKAHFNACKTRFSNTQTQYSSIKTEYDAEKNALKQDTAFLEWDLKQTASSPTQQTATFPFSLTSYFVNNAPTATLETIENTLENVEAHAKKEYSLYFEKRENLLKTIQESLAKEGINVEEEALRDTLDQKVATTPPEKQTGFFSSWFSSNAAETEKLNTYKTYQQDLRNYDSHLEACHKATEKLPLLIEKQHALLNKASQLEQEGEKLNDIEAQYTQAELRFEKAQKQAALWLTQTKLEDLSPEYDAEKETPPESTIAFSFETQPNPLPEPTVEMQYQGLDY